MTLETPLWIQNGRFPSYADRLLISTLLRPGIPGNEDPPITIPNTTTVTNGANVAHALDSVPRIGDLAVSLAGTTLSVAPGTCIIQGTDQTRQGNYICRSTDQVQFSLGSAAWPSR